MLFKRELKFHFKGFLVTTLITSALSAYMIALIPSFGADMQEMLDMKLPEQLQLAFGMDGLNFAKPMQSYSILNSYLILAFSIFSSMTAGRIVAKEFADKTAEFLYSLPMRRMDSIFIKLGVAVLYLTASIAVMGLVTVVAGMASLGADFETGTFGLMLFGFWATALFFGALSFLISAFYVRTAMAVGLVLIAYIMQLVISLKDELEAVAFLSPFDWFKGNEIVTSGSLEWLSVIVCFAATMVCLVWGARKFLKKDVLV